VFILELPVRSTGDHRRWRATRAGARADRSWCRSPARPPRGGGWDPTDPPPAAPGPGPWHVPLDRGTAGRGADEHRDPAAVGRGQGWPCPTVPRPWWASPHRPW